MSTNMSKPPAPTPLRPFVGKGIPQALRDRPRWAPWKAVWNERRAKWDKIPVRADNSNIGLSTQRPNQWFTYEAALRCYQRNKDTLAGIGYCVTGIHGVVAIDIDHCVNPDGSLSEMAWAIIAKVGSYTEWSPSGNGVRIPFGGSVTSDAMNHDLGLEMYGGHTARFVTITGDPIEDCPTEMREVPDEVIDELVLDYGLARQTAEVIDLTMPDPLDEEHTPPLELLELPPGTTRFLTQGDAGFDRSATLHQAGVALYAAGLEDEDVLAILEHNVYAMGIALDHRGQDPERARSYLWREHCVKARAKGRAQRVTADDFDVVVVPDNAPPPAPNFQRNRAGQIEATLVSVLAALRHQGVAGMQVAWDTFIDELMCSAPWSKDQWRLFTDNDYARIKETLTRFGFKEVPMETLRDAVALVAEEGAFDSAQIWLKGLPAHDGVPRIETFLSTYFRADDTPYTRAVSCYLWSAMAGRTLSPGCQADMAAVMLSLQGKGKTQGVKAMVPDPRYYIEINLAHRDGDLSRSLRGKLIGELGELRGLASREAEDIKAWVSRTTEEWVPKYKEFTTRYQCRLALVGTSNQDQFLTDPTGNRRWLPVRTDTVDVAAIERDRDQLWAEARDRFAVHGIEWREAEKLGRAVHAEHMVHDSWEDRIAEWMLTPDELSGECPENRKFIRIGEILQEALGLQISHVRRAEELRVGAILRKWNWERRKIREGGRTPWAYVPLRS